MISISEKKLIKSLALKKYRDSEKLFVAEGEKLVNELFNTFALRFLFTTDDALLTQFPAANRITPNEMKQISQLKTPSNVLAVFHQPTYTFAVDSLADELILVLDSVQNPGNLGTIMRLADWFGIKHLVCSRDCADIFNPKTVQATMGALARVQVHYTDLLDFFDEYKKLNLPVYGTFLDGENLHTTSLNIFGAVVMGNEGNGISAAVAERVTKRITIPNYPQGAPTSESLNVAVATAIVCAEFRR